MFRKEFLCRHNFQVPMSNFDKSHFRKDGLAPVCNTCGARTRSRDENGLHWMCAICNHPVNDNGDCVAQRRCVACKGKPRCSSCERVSEVNNSGGFSCFSCGHSLTDNGHCADDPCYVCNPHRCNTCDSKLTDAPDENGEIYCNECDHHVDQSGNCMDTERSHCDTCDSYPDCPACGADTYHEDGEDEDDTGDYYCEDDCSHRLDYDGNCMSDPCPDCGEPCTNCGAKVECENGPSCEWEADGECRFCHCNDDDDDDDWY